MSETKQMLFARNLVCLCIDDEKNADYQGKLWHQYSDEALDFTTMSDFLITADELFDSWDFPQRSLERREFGREEIQSHRHSSLPRIEIEDNSSDELTIDRVQRQSGTRNIQNKKGKLGTFIIQVAFRQNATWQGNVIHVENNEASEFISAMELIRFIDKAVNKK